MADRLRISAPFPPARAELDELMRLVHVTDLFGKTRQVRIEGGRIWVDCLIPGDNDRRQVVEGMRWLLVIPVMGIDVRVEEI